MLSSHKDLMARYGPYTSLSEIPWSELPVDLQETCWDFIREWQNDLEMDRLKEVSGLNEMNLADLLAYKELRNAVHDWDRRGVV